MQTSTSQQPSPIPFSDIYVLRLPYRDEETLNKLRDDLTQYTSKLCTWEDVLFIMFFDILNNDNVLLNALSEQLFFRTRPSKPNPIGDEVLRILGLTEDDNQFSKFLTAYDNLLLEVYDCYGKLLESVCKSLGKISRKNSAFKLQRVAVSDTGIRVMFTRSTHANPQGFIGSLVSKE